MKNNKTKQSAPSKNVAVANNQEVKESKNRSYGSSFLKNHSMTSRGQKTIYVRDEYHERLTRIIQVIGENEIPIYAYLDNILEHHFELFEKAITKDFNDKYKPIFKQNNHDTK